MGDELWSIEDFENVLWDYGISLPFPLHLGPSGPVGVSTSRSRTGRRVEDDIDALTQRWGPLRTRHLLTLVSTLRTTVSSAFLYVVAEDRDEFDSRVTATAIVGDDRPIVVVESPTGIWITMTPWDRLGTMLAGFLPQIPSWSFPTLSVRAEGLQSIAEMTTRSVPAATIDRAMAREGFPMGLYRMMEKISERTVAHGFFGAAREDREGRQLGDIAGDFVAAPHGGFVRVQEGGRILFEPLEPTALPSLLVRCLASVPAARSSAEELRSPVVSRVH
ncbi:hypothetical protein KEM60_00210 [Austwickia sp. TVS 96-490-7B]|uniref:ESX secretion-associated protein EspG n=1 Tax=Austwickia sp. TVS 96-490-7B TaxID=2830843 RepID=UPI001C5A2A64|nr:ESX secretion-associated protein EspG [Austwickia sp. TVS 96-490-7B]MBW3084027.1 hypothetical protein [Austwickia sp. TVS 96-490-7B]